MKFGPLLFLLSFNLYALECGNIPEGEVFRIDQGNGSLANASIQDQDGVGSCFANQAALLLQSAMPGNPNLSYLNLGLYYTNDMKLKFERNQGNPLFTSKKNLDDGKVDQEGYSAILGGYTCQTIEAAKERQRKSGSGSVCKSEDVNLEHSYFDSNRNYNDSNHEQEKTLVSASRYMNSYQKRFGYAFDRSKMTKAEFAKKQEEADRFSEALTKFVKNSSDSYLQDKCVQKKPERLEDVLTNTLTRTLSSSPECIVKNKLSSSGGTICKALEQFGYISISSNSRMVFILKQDVRRQLNSESPKFYKSRNGRDGFNNLVNGVFRQVDKSKLNQTQKNAFLRAFNNNISPIDRGTLESENKYAASAQVDKCKSDNFLSYFKDKKQFLEKSKQDAVLCNYSDLLERASDLAGVMPTKTFNNISTFVDFITTKAGLDYDEAILSLVATDCTPDKRLSIPENIRCDQERYDFSPQDFRNNKVSYSAAQRIKSARAKMLGDLKRNQAIGLDICTKFWKEPNYNYHTDDPETKQKKCSESSIHGFHAITMIGYRCKNNRLQYLSQNSWGPNWRVDNNAFEVENGKIWMDEDTVFQNLDAINYISK